MLRLTDDSGCAAGCGVAGVDLSQGSSEAFGGGSGCDAVGTGDGICTCDFPGHHGAGTHTTIYFHVNGGLASGSDDPGARRGANSSTLPVDPTLCREACRASATCTYAFFGWWTGVCHLFSYTYLSGYTSPRGTCPRQTVWVGTRYSISVEY